MATLGDWEDRAPASSARGDMRAAAPTSGVSFLDLLVRLWRAKWIMVLVGAPIFLMGLLIALQMPTKYEATAGLFVRAGDELRVSSIISDPYRDTLPEAEQIIQGELELLRGPVVAERALAAFPLERVYPDIAKARNRALRSVSAQSPAEIEAEFRQEAAAEFQRSFWAGVRPNNPVINVAFENEDPVVSADVLNAALAAYLQYRAELFGERPVAKLIEQRTKGESELIQLEDQIALFLNENGIGDFDRERTTAQELFTQISSDLLTNRSRASAVQGQLSTTRSQLTTIEPEQNIFVEDTSQQALASLKVEREQLRARYTPDSHAVRNIDQQIAQVEAFLANQDGPTGTIRTGPNPLYQSVETSLKTLEAEAVSLQVQQRELQRQLDQLEARLTRFTLLQPRWNQLQRQRALLEENIDSLGQRVQQEGALVDLASGDVESVRITDQARVPLRGSSLKFPVALLSLLIAGFTALCAGLIYAFTRGGFATPQALSRATGLPVLAIADR
ncbi:MAG: Wzz/FepE/Etk N-terminal domain-containing protein [Pseudomonadota bacterium]